MDPLGRGRDSRIRTLFAFAPEARIRPNLGFFENASDVVGRRFEPIFATAFDRAVKNACRSGISVASFSNSQLTKPPLRPSGPDWGVDIVARVLIVEDESTDLIFLRSIVEASGHEVYVASDGEQAFKTYLRKSIEIVITDLQMPHVDGLELIEALRALYPEARIIAVSGKGQDLLDAAKHKGAFVAFSKPIDPQELLKALVQATPHGSAAPARRDVGLACEAGVSGNYTLVAVSGQELPATVEFFGTITVRSGSLTLTSDSTFTATYTFFESDGDPETENDSGTFTLDESNVIHFTPGPESDNNEPFEGTLDGEQITVPLDDDVTLVFRR